MASSVSNNGRPTPGSGATAVRIANVVPADPDSTILKRVHVRLIVVDTPCICHSNTLPTLTDWCSKYSPDQPKWSDLFEESILASLLSLRQATA